MFSQVPELENKNQLKFFKDFNKLFFQIIYCKQELFHSQIAIFRTFSLILKDFARDFFLILKSHLINRNKE